MVYTLLTTLLRPILPFYLIWRGWRGKEDPKRRGERYGKAGHSRPDGTLCWLHAVSVGESVSALVLASAILKQKPDATILITSGTVTSAQMIQDRSRSIEGNIIHQYVPLDVPSWANRFLDHWRPDLAVMVEGDLWPGLISASVRRGIPLAMASAQISEKSVSFWTSRGKALAHRIFPHFEAIFTVDDIHADRFSCLPVKAGAVQIGGSFKIAAMPLPDDPELVSKINAAADGRRIILLASSHEGDETLFLNALEQITPPKTLAIIAPRHPMRAKGIIQELEERGMTCRQRSKSEWPEPTDTIWLADKMGEMGGLIRAAEIIVLGGGFSPLGGHNPMEMAALGKGVVSGTAVFKNRAAFDLLDERDGVIFCDDSETLKLTLDLLMTSPTRFERLNTGAFNAWKSLSGSTDTIAGQLLNLIREGR